MDALTHAIEAYVSTLHCPFLLIRWHCRPSRWYWKTFRLLTEAIWMPESRCTTHSAWLVCPSPTLCWESYIPWHTTGAAFSTGHIPHGCANAIYLPYVIRYNAKEQTAASRYAEIARRMGLDGTSEKALINSLCEKIDDFNRQLNIPEDAERVRHQRGRVQGGRLPRSRSWPLATPAPVPIREPSIRQQWRSS